MYTGIHYYCPFPAAGQPKELEVVVKGEHAYERYLIYLAQEVYPGRTDLYLGGKTLWDVRSHVAKALDPALVLDLPSLPKDYIWTSITEEELAHHALRKLARNAMSALETFWFAQRKLEAVIGECPDIQDILEDFTNGVERASNADGPTLDRLITLLRQGVDNATD